MSYRPIFIAGCDRSGTTLLGDMLGNTRWSVTTPESQFIHDLLIQIGLGSFTSPEQAAHWLLNHFRYAAWNLSLTVTELAGLIVLDQPRQTIENLISAYARHTHPGKPDADIWIDHTPDNFKVQTMLKRHFPEARFIHIVRDGRAVCASIKPLDWGPNNAYIASRHWATRLQEALTVEVAEGDNCLRVRFEDLLLDTAQTLRRVCAFIDLPFEASIASGGGLVLPQFTRTQHRLVGKQLDTSRAGDWQNKLGKTEIRDFESYPLSHTLLARMGYPTMHPEPPQLSSAHVLGRYCHEFVHYLINRSRHRSMERSAVSKYQDALISSGEEQAMKQLTAAQHS